MSLTKLVTTALVVCGLMAMIAAGCGDSGSREGANRKPIYGPGSTGHLGSAAIASQQAG